MRLTTVYCVILILCSFVLLGTQAIGGIKDNSRYLKLYGDNSRGYAIKAAQDAKRVYHLSKRIYNNRNKEQVLLYADTALFFARECIAAAETAIGKSRPNDAAAINYMKRSKAYANRAIDALNRIVRKPKKPHYYSKEAIVAAGNAVVNAYNASIYFSDVINPIKLKTAKEVFAKLDKEVKLLPALKPSTHLQDSPEENKITDKTAVKSDALEQQKNNGQIPVADTKENEKIAAGKETATETSDTQEDNTTRNYILGGVGLLSLLSLVLFSVHNNSVAKANAANADVVAERGQKVDAFLREHADIDSDHTQIQMSTNAFNVNTLKDNHYSSIININKINDMRNINGFFAAVNAKLPLDGCHIACVETSAQRRIRLLHKFPPVLSHLYFASDFLFKRVFPKLPVTRSLYFFVTAGRNRVLSEAEALGRLAACGFMIAGTREINNQLYFVGRKKKEAPQNNLSRLGPLFSMKRVGYKGKEIKVHKFRTMHPYAEHLQDYVYQKNQLQDGGKFKNDFRITPWGRFMRRLWIDELPMLLNFFKGEVKLVGVRPLSAQYLGLYSEALQEKRKQFKPGLVPPFYSDLPKTLDEIQQSEHLYLDAYSKSPFKTDVRYFFKAMHNIIFKKVRSH